MGATERFNPITKGPDRPYQQTLPSVQQRNQALNMEMNMKDVLEEIAGENDLRMIPTKRTNINTNKKLYTFGKQIIFWENTVVYSEKKDGKFEPVPLDTLLQMA